MAPDYVVLGLGNPGQRYDSTRHNLGFWVVDRLAERRRVRLAVDPAIGRRAWTAEARFGPARVVLAKPRTYMNRSGRAAQALCLRHDLAPQRLLVIHDEADLALGRLRLRAAGSSGGHGGIRSILDALGTSEFPRIRLGVRGEARDEGELADYVLDSFTSAELPLARALAELGADAVESVIEHGVPEAMNRFNGRRAQMPSSEGGAE